MSSSAKVKINHKIIGLAAAAAAVVVVVELEVVITTAGNACRIFRLLQWHLFY